MSTNLPTTEAEKQAFFANIVAQYSERLYWTVRRIVLDHDDADDVLQNVLLRRGAIWTIFRTVRKYPHGCIVLL